MRMRQARRAARQKMAEKYEARTRTPGPGEERQRVCFRVVRWDRYFLQKVRIGISTGNGADHTGCGGGAKASGPPHPYLHPPLEGRRRVGHYIVRWCMVQCGNHLPSIFPARNVVLEWRMCSTTDVDSIPSAEGFDKSQINGPTHGCTGCG